MTGAMLLPEFDQEMANTRKALERVPDDKLDFKPHEKSFSLHDLAAHVANIPTWTGVTLTTTELDLSQSWERSIPANRAELLTAFDAAVAAARPVLEKATADDFSDEQA